MNTQLLNEWINENAPQGTTKLAAKLEINPATITRILKGQQPSLDTLRRMADLLGVTLDELSKPEPKKKRVG